METQTIPIHSKLIEPLETRMKESVSGDVFEGQAGGPVCSVWTAFTNACTRAKLRGVTPST